MSERTHSSDSHPPPAKPQLAETCDQAADEKAAELVRILDQHLAELKAGNAPSHSELVARHPGLASQLEACLAGLEFIHGAEAAAGRTQRLGDFQIIREVGRGGMGAVFEAEQISLGRKVALKILRFGGVSDPEAVERFQREAETVAKLHHTNIVPIFAVGSERGVNYYAMQFIDGHSLADVLAAKRQPLPPEQVAEWGLQAAEALTHAHQRGVIHRDVKPSNLLLDPDNRIWLTDFGLARRMDDVTLSMTGALLGTPRYMSPEQAVASKKRVDHRSDLFSLGATLYELLTGKPAFAGDTPHDVIQQILTGEPKSIRQINPAVPRDLETIVMKCLAKEPAKRYSAARDLADDLRAFLDGRPIRARRASIVELASRWIKSQQRSAKLMATAAALTLAITLVAIFGWSGYDQWRRGTIKLGTASPPLVAEILDRQGNPLRRETLPMQEVVSLPEGEYQVRATSEGTLSETFDLDLVRNNDLTHSVDLLAERLLSMDIARSFAFADLGEKRRSIVLLGNDGIAPFGWMPPQAGPNSPALKESPGFQWPWSDGTEQHSGFDAYDQRPWIAPRGSDLDGDGKPDLICAGRHQGWLMAISGKDGGILWFAGRGADLKNAKDANRPYYARNSVTSAVIGVPILDRDCNRDGTLDVIATFADAGVSQVRLAGDQVAARCWVEAVSGKTGQTIWIYELPPSWFELPQGTEVPYQCRWFVGGSTGSSSRGRGMMRSGRHAHRRPGQVERTGTHAYRPDPVRAVKLSGQTRLAVVGGTHTAVIDPDTGKEVQPPCDIRQRPGRELQWADVDGDGADDLVLLSERPAKAGIDYPLASIAVWSVAKGKELWSQDLEAHWPLTQSWTVEPPQWPLVADLNGDEKYEIVVPDGSSNPSGYFGSGSSAPWGKVSVREGASGKELWNRRLVTMDLQIDRMIDGPDLDNDGWREIYVATLSGGESRMFVDCLSGHSGKTLWSCGKAPPTGVDGPQLAPLRWWNAGEDGWPQLIVEAVDDAHGGRKSLICTYSAGTGAVTHVGRGITSLSPADVDRDGIEDLVVFDAPSDRLDFGGRMHVIRGKSAEPWRRIGNASDPVADLDGDGVVDLVQAWADGTVLARSGRTSRDLWRGSVASGTRAAGVRPAGGDLDGDGTPDLLVWADTFGPRRKSTPFYGLSGRTGKVLWNASDVGLEFMNAVLAGTAADLDRDGKPEVIWMAACDHEYPAGRTSWSSHDQQLWLFVVSGQTGALKWKQPLSRPYGEAPGDYLQVQVHGIWLTPAVGDADGDGTADVLVPAIAGDGKAPQSLETRVLSGKSGQQLWSRPFAFDTHQQDSFDLWIPPTVCDVDGDRRADVAVLELFPDPTGTSAFRVAMLRGRDGSQRWEHNTQVRSGYTHSVSGLSRGSRIRPLALAAGAKRQRIGVYLPGNDGKACVLEADGTAHECKIGYRSNVGSMFACDVDRDGREEVAFLDKSSLVVAAADKLDTPLWTYDTGSAGQGQILGIVAEPGRTPTIGLFADPMDNTVRGFDAASGKIVWTCPGPLPRTEGGSTIIANQVVLLGAAKEELPFIYYAYDSITRCRQAAGVPSPTMLAGISRGVAASPPVLNFAGPDPRWQRNLPWVEQHMEQIPWGQAAVFFGWGLFFSTLLIVVPAGYLARLVWLRRFGLKMLLVLPIIASLFLTAALLRGPAENDFATLQGRLMIGLILAPAVIGIGLLLWWTVRGQWPRALLWFGITLLVSFVQAGFILWYSARYQPLTGEETYNWAGWYLIWFAGAYMTSWIAIILLPTKFAIVSLWKWRCGHKSPPQVASPSDPTMAAIPAQPAAGEPVR